MLKKLKLNGSMKTYKIFQTNTQKRCPFHYRGLECKDVESQEIPGVTGKSGLGVQNEAKANRALLREHTGHSKHSLPTIQEKTLHMSIPK